MLGGGGELFGSASSFTRGPGEYLGGGTLIYPIPGMSLEASMMKLGWQALPSVRLEAARDGLEDYEYFVLLRKAIEKAKAGARGDEVLAAAEKLLAVPTEIQSDDFHPSDWKPTQYTKDDPLVREHRDRIARAIELLERK